MRVELGNHRKLLHMLDLTLFGTSMYVLISLLVWKHLEI